MNKYDVIIIGSGLGSLVCANILSREGFHVCVLEKHAQAGGCLQNFSRHNHSFDTGVHYLGGMLPGQPLYNYWNYLGILPGIKLHRLDADGFDIIAFDKGEFPLAQGFEHFSEQLLPYFPKGKDALTNYIQHLLAISTAFPLYNLEIPETYSREDLFRSRSACQFLTNLTTGIRNPESGIQLSSVLAGNNFLYAGDRDSTPLHHLALTNHVFISSAWQLAGGSNQLTLALGKNIEKNGGSLLLRNEVSSIHHANDRFTIRTKAGEVFFSSIVISGIHPANTYRMMDTSLVRPMTRNRIFALPNTGAAFSLFLCLKKDAIPYQNYNYHFFKNFNVWSTSSSGAEWPLRYMLYTPFPPNGGIFAETMIVMTYLDFSMFKRWENTTVGRRGQEYLETKHLLENKLLDVVEQKYPCLRQNITYMESATPLTWRDYTGTPEGSMYGIRKDFSDSVRTTILPRTKIPNFYFTGQNINLHGLLGVTIGAVTTCGEILGLENLLNKIRNAR